jgi:hypothetical protein
MIVNESNRLQSELDSPLRPVVATTEKIQASRFDFIWTDLDVILTFATIAESEYKMGNLEHAERTLAAAEKGYSEMLRLSSHAKGLTPGIEGEFQSKFKHARERLDRLRRLR